MFAYTRFCLARLSNLIYLCFLGTFGLATMLPLRPLYYFAPQFNQVRDAVKQVDRVLAIPSESFGS